MDGCGDRDGPWNAAAADGGPGGPWPGGAMPEPRPEKDQPT